MRKCLILTSLLLAAIVPSLRAQSLFNAPDTVCIRQPIQLENLATGSNSYYWSFCSGSLLYAPSGTDLGTGMGLSNATAVEIARDGSNYYGFVANRATGELLKLSFGDDLGSVPVVTNMGDLNNTFPDSVNALYVVQAGNNWHLFAAGGSTQANSTLARFDFGTSLANTANGVNFGNPGNMLNAPEGLFIAQEGSNWYGYTINTNGGESLVRITIGANISTTPTLLALGNFGGMTTPSDFAAIQSGGNWYLFVTNSTINTITRIDLGNSLINAPSGTDIGNLGGRLFNPSGIAISRDCSAAAAIITNGLSNDMVRLDLTAPAGPYTATPLANPGGTLATPLAISGILRDKDDLYAFVSNGNDRLAQVAFAQCNSSSVVTSSAANPPVYSYSSPGTYNVTLTVNDGQPNMQVECKQIVALAIPPFTVSPPDTVLCQGDSIWLVVQSPGALSYTWRPYYNMSDTVGVTVRVWPEYTVPYRIHIPYANGCIVDTVINVEVYKNKADAGPDRTLLDGAHTLLGGPLTTVGNRYTYTWTPPDFLSSTTDPNPTATPAYDFTYYLEVTDDHGCRDIDTVVVLTSCNDLNLPNAFAPESASTTGSNTFGILNKQIVKLNYFRVFDRWGKKVFETTNAAEAWDGKVDGSFAPLGVYVWVAEGYCVSGRKFKRSGNVTLIR